MQYTDIKLWLVGDILLKADKMSMANSLELRVPYLDSKVFEIARKIFRIKEIQKMLEAHMSGKQDCWRQIWCIYVFILWYKEYFVKR